jgi:hypothetical protein
VKAGHSSGCDRDSGFQKSGQFLAVADGVGLVIVVEIDIALFSLHLIDRLRPLGKLLVGVVIAVSAGQAVKPEIADGGGPKVINGRQRRYPQISSNYFIAFGVAEARTSRYLKVSPFY